MRLRTGGTAGYPSAPRTFPSHQAAALSSPHWRLCGLERLPGSFRDGRATLLGKPGDQPRGRGGRLGLRHDVSDVSGSRLVVTHGRYDDTDPRPSLRRVHSTLDIYDRHTGIKLYEDVPLPDTSEQQN